MKKIILLLLTVSALLISCGKNFSGVYTGYSWREEVKGVSLENATQKIETVLTLNRKGIILDAKMQFLVQDKDGKWFARQDTAAEVSVDFSIRPEPAVPQGKEVNYSAGKSMFKIKTADKMSFYASAVSNDGVSALTIVEPFTRYQYEYRFDQGFDFSTPLKNMTIGSGIMVPVIRTSSGGYIKPSSWDEYANHNILSFYKEHYVITGTGVFKGITPESTAGELLERAGVAFSNNNPVSMDVKYGFFGAGGWEGNYRAISSFLKGKDAKKLTSLVNWNSPRYSSSINPDNFFGVDVQSGATRTVQDSVDGIAGATVRMSRESASYQRALVKAGIIQEKDVIKGRF